MERDIDLIRHLYIDENKTIKEISEIIGGVSLSTIRRDLILNGVQIKPKGNYRNKEYHIPSPFKEEVKDVEKLKDLYLKCIPVNKISEILGVGRRAINRKVSELGLVRPKSMMARGQYDDTKDEEIIKLYGSGKSLEYIADVTKLSRRSVKNHLKHCGVDLRSISDSLFLYNGKEFPTELANYEDLYDMYVVQKLSKKNIAETLNVAPSVVDRCLKSYGIHIRNSSEAKFGLMVGEKHPNWKGGRTELYSRLREYFKVRQVQEVLKRDGYRCQLCGSKKKLQVHHIKHFKDIFEEILSEHKELDLVNDSNKLYDIITKDNRFTNFDNLITYCKDCHLYKIHKYKKKETQ